MGLDSTSFSVFQPALATIDTPSEVFNNANSSQSAAEATSALKHGGVFEDNASLRNALKPHADFRTSYYRSYTGFVIVPYLKECSGDVADDADKPPVRKCQPGRLAKRRKQAGGGRRENSCMQPMWKEGISCCVLCPGVLMIFGSTCPCIDIACLECHVVECHSWVHRKKASCLISNRIIHSLNEYVCCLCLVLYESSSTTLSENNACKCDRSRLVRFQTVVKSVWVGDMLSCVP